MKQITVIPYQELKGRVTFTDKLRLEITVGMSPKPDAKLYVDGNLLQLKKGEEVIVTIARNQNG